MKKYKNAQELISALEEIKDSNSYLPSSINRNAIVNRYLEQGNKKNSLSGYLCSIKDLISNTDGIVTGGSKFLDEYKPPFNASIYKALKREGATNVVNANLDEFGLGGTGLFSFVGTIPNSVNDEYISGGSSSGSAYLVKNGFVDFSIGSDTGDSARYPAALAGIIGFKPSFGAVSRYGFFPFCSAFDTPAILTNSMNTLARVFSVISFPDPNDLCTLSTKKIDYLEALKKPINKNLRIAILDDTFWNYSNTETETSKEVREKFDSLVKDIKDDLGFYVETYSFSDPRLLRLCELIYRVVAYSESISNYANLTGILFPFKVATEEGSNEETVEIINIDNGKSYQEILTNNRSVLGEEFVLRQIIGKHFLEKENYEEIYLKSKRLLTRINREIKKLFKCYDLVISPTISDLPPKIKEWKRSYSPRNTSNIMLLANFCSLPAISIP